MEFGTCKIDFSRFDDGDIVTVISESFKGYLPFMSAAMRKLPPTANINNVRAAIIGAPAGKAAYLYLTKKIQTARSLMSHEVLTHAFVTGANVAPIDNLTMTISVEKSDDSIDVAAQKLNGLKKSDLPKAFEKASVGIDLPEKSKGFAVKFSKDTYAGYLANGDPCFDTLGREFLLAENIRVEPVYAREIVTAHVLVDAVTLDKGVLKPKLPSEKFAILPAGDVEVLKSLAIDATAYFGTFMSSKNTARGRALLRLFLQAMIASRDSSDYKAFIVKVERWANSKRAVVRPRMLGDFKPGSVQYSSQLLGITRGIRGGDDKDSSSTGISGYFEYNVDRTIIKALARAQDVSTVLKLIPNKQVYFTGKAARQFVCALLMIDANLIVGSSSINFPGWRLEEGYYRHANFKTLLTTDIGGLIFNTDIMDMGPATSHAYDTHGQVQLITCPLDYDCGRYVPSVLVHNLTGWLLPVGVSLTKPRITQIRDEYLVVADTINVLRTYPSLYPVERPCHFLTKWKWPVLVRQYYNRLASGAKNVGQIFLMMSDGVSELADFMTEEQQVELVDAIEYLKVEPLQAPSESGETIDTDNVPVSAERNEEHLADL